MTEKKKMLSMFDLVSIGVGSVIGAGIFSMLGTGISMTGRSVALALVVAMFVVFMQQIRPLFIASMFALDGGLYAQQALALPRILTGMGSIILVVSNLSFSVFGISIASYLSYLIPSLAPYQKIVGVIVLTFFFAASTQGTKFLAKIQNVMAVCMYGALIMFIVMGIGKVQTGGFPNEPYFIAGPTGFLMATAIMSFTCNGASNLYNVSGDTENATKKIPLSILYTTIICAALYFLIGYVASGVMPYAQVAGKELGFVAQTIMPKAPYVLFIIGGAIFALTTSLLGGVAAMKYPILASAEDGWLPVVFTKKTKKGFPYVIMGFMYILAVAPVIGGFTLDSIVAFILVPGMILGFFSNLYSLKIPKKYPEAWAKCGMHCPYWVYVTALIVSMVANLFTAFFSMMGLTPTALIGNIGLTVFLFVYAWYRDKKGYVNLKSIESIDAK